MVIVVKPEVGSPNSVKLNGRGTSSAVAYDPSVVYILELATLLAIRDETTSAAVGREVAEALQNVVRDANNTHPLTLSRAIFYLLYLLKIGHVYFRPGPSTFLADIDRINPSFELQWFYTPFQVSTVP